MTRKSVYKTLFCLLFLILATSASGQRKSPRSRNVKPTVEATPTPTPTPVSDAENEMPGKKNSRPAGKDLTTNLPPPSNGTGGINQPSVQSTSAHVYSYEFSQPEFVFSKIFVEHNENGRGTIRFLKKYLDEEITEAIELSAPTLEKLKTLWQTLSFLDSDENYQFERDYSHLGQIALTMKDNGRERTATFNYTTNPDAKALTDEYRRIGNQYIWKFEINVSRENQPLESARQMDSFELQMRRNEFSDLEQLIPFLKELSDDERLPLISRNHASRIVKEIEKQLIKKKSKK